MNIKTNYIEEYQKLLDALKEVLTPLETSSLATITLLVQPDSISVYAMADTGYNMRLAEVLLAPDDWHKEGHLFYVKVSSRKEKYEGFKAKDFHKSSLIFSEAYNAFVELIESRNNSAVL